MAVRYRIQSAAVRQAARSDCRNGHSLRSWVRSSHRCSVCDSPTFPADDFIGHIIFWNQRAVRAMTARIEEVTGLEWIDALYRAHEISEYMLYGFAV